MPHRSPLQSLCAPLTVVSSEDKRHVEDTPSLPIESSVEWWGRTRSASTGLEVAGLSRPITKSPDGVTPCQRGQSIQYHPHGL